MAKRQTINSEVKGIEMNNYTTKEEVIDLLDKVVEMINKSGWHDNAAFFRDIITSLRGPDDENKDIKHHTTAVIRGVIGIAHSSHLDINEKRESFNNSKQGNLPHFHYHVQRAREALSELGIWKDKESSND